MLLRRFKSHVEKENWFAVFLDFLIVVSGVFIGVQLGNWNEARSDKRDVVRALERLQGEIQSNIASAQSGVDRLNLTKDLRREALADMQACKDDTETKDNIISAISAMTGDIVPSFVTNMTEEIGRRDRFTDLLSGEFRTALNLYDAQLSDEVDQLKTNFGLLWDQHIIYNPSVTMTYQSDASMGASYGLDSPLSELCQDAIFKRQMIMTNVWHESTAIRLERFIGYNVTFSDAIESELDRRF